MARLSVLEMDAKPQDFGYVCSTDDERMKATVKKRQVVTGSDGEPVGVFLPIEEYNALLDELEELEDIKDYDRIKALNEPVAPLREAIVQRKISNA